MRFQFTMRRAMLATTLVAVGLACWPMAGFVSELEYVPFDFAPVLVVLCFALPAAGIGSLFSRTLKGLYIGLTVGVVAGLSLMVYVISHIGRFY
jgi:hypothetical protein